MQYEFLKYGCLQEGNIHAHKGCIRAVEKYDRKDMT